MSDVSLSRVDRIYAVLSGDDAEDRSCAAIPDAACTDVPRNFLLNVANGACTKLAEQLASPALVLPWLLVAMQAPAGLAGFLMPMKQTGSLLPQMAVAGVIRRFPTRKWFWSGAGLSQAILLGLMALVAVLFSGAAAGTAVVALFALFCVASGIGSVAFQDVTGKTVPKGRRGRMLSLRGAIGGALTLGAALVLASAFSADAASLKPLVVLVLVSAVLWAAGAVVFALIEETPGATSGGRSILLEMCSGLTLYRGVPGFRRYLHARAALVGIEIAAPFFALHGREVTGAALTDLGLFVLGVGLANVVSSPVWGSLSDRSSRNVMRLSCCFAVGAVVVALAVDRLLVGMAATWVYVAVFVLIGLAEAGVRTGRKTYLVDAAPEEDRPLYVAFSNTAIGLFALPLGAVGLIGQAWGSDVMLLTVMVIAVLAYLLASAMPEADDMLG